MTDFLINKFIANNKEISDINTLKLSNWIAEGMDHWKSRLSR